MNQIIRKKNDGYLVIEVLNSYEDLNDGDRYVFLGKDNKVLHATSRRTSLERMGKVIWDYGIRKRDVVISRF